MSVNIILDSTIDLSASSKAAAEIVPLTVHFGEEEYLDGVTINHQQFYEKLAESKVLPTTSQATPATFEKIFERITAAGDSAVVITLSSKLSGTYQSAVIAAEDFDNVYVVDSTNVTIGAGVLAEYAISCVQNGMSAKEIAQALEEKKDKVCMIAMLDTLEFLKRGGRISATAAFAGGLLNIKPVISIQDGEIVMLGKARGVKQGNQLVSQEIEKTGGIDFDLPVLLGYTGLSDELLNKYVQESTELWNNRAQDLSPVTIGSVVGTHAGPGAFAAAFFKK